MWRRHDRLYPLANPACRSREVVAGGREPVLGSAPVVDRDHERIGQCTQSPACQVVGVEVAHHQPAAVGVHDNQGRGGFGWAVQASLWAVGHPILGHRQLHQRGLDGQRLGRRRIACRACSTVNHGGRLGGGPNCPLAPRPSEASIGWATVSVKTIRVSQVKLRSRARRGSEA